MKNKLSKINLMVLTILLPVIYGCGGGGGIGELTSLLFGGSLGIGGGSGALGGLGGGAAASLVNPEPTTMLLVGGGVTAMAIYRNRKNRNSK